MTPGEGLTLNVGDRVVWTGITLIGGKVIGSHPASYVVYHGEVVNKVEPGFVSIRWDDGCEGEFRFGNDEIRWDLVKRAL